MAATSKAYTLDADFDEGTLVGVEHDTAADQLQLSEKAVTLPFIWVPNYDGTVSKVDTETGDELGRYRVAPHSSCDPSRTTVDLQGNCWVGNRGAGTVVKIGLFEAGQYIDRNGDGKVQTSEDLNGDGDITGAEILDWGKDECVLYEVVLINDKEGTYAPGEYTGEYDYDYWGTAPRGLAVDSKNNLWAGTSSSQKYYYINGETGAIEETLDVSSWGHSAYGAVIDKNGVLWSAKLSEHILRINTADLTDITLIPLGSTYGMGLDYSNYLFVGSGGQLTKIDINDKGTPIEWTKSAMTMRGVVCTADNNVWVAGTDENWNYNSVSRYDNDGNLIQTISGFNSPSGVAVDAAGKVWVTDISSENIYRINPDTNSVDLTKNILGSGGHYTYSDMTGIVARTITTKVGTWTVDFDSEEADMPWGTFSWNANEPTGTSVKVEVRSSNDGNTWSPWETAANGVSLSSTPDGRYLQIKTTMQINSGEVSPILYDLSVEAEKPANMSPVANAGEDQTVEQANLAGTSITLDGSGSTDDGLIEPLTYAWIWDGGSAEGVNPEVTLPLGTTTITLEVYDGQFSATDTVDITVEDTTPPEITTADEPIVLWPANHKYQTVLISYFVTSVADICDAGVGINSIAITSVSSDEPEEVTGNGDGNTLEDIVIVDSQTVDLRAERQGDGNGRVYTINYAVTDASGNTVAGFFQVWVPHDQGAGATAVDDGAVAGYTVNYP
ncbi:MAG: hypothetical protein PHF18_03345 [Methanosarcina sp.]|uniref:hypothetical protein n=1 Tax=Methanosarcina sp. TaxID=2213 RepID=UPI0026358BDB|nr:hypothetical protein [Methanosarcina sp.]MDD3245889.1 hypothetical protein [Methanosarcina sp.]